MSRKKIKPEIEYPKVERMLWQLAHRAECDPLFPLDEAFSEACVGFMRACTTFNPERGTRFSSWVYFKAGAHLRTARKKVLVRPVMVEIKEELAGAAPANRKEWLEMLDDLSADARLLIHLIIESPIEIVKEVPISPRQLLRKVCEELGYVKGWDRIYTQITLFEIRAQFGIE